MSDMKKYLAELLGTFVLVFVGTGSAVVAGKYIGFLGISLAFGLSFLVLVYAIGQISGCHINPAITVAMLLNGKIPAKDAIIYIIVQCIGSRPATNDPMSSTGNVHTNLMKFNFGRIKPRSEPGSWKGCGAISPPDPWNRFKAKPTGITIVNTERFDRLGLYISSAPVEEKGYKRIIKLPD